MRSAGTLLCAVPSTCFGQGASREDPAAQELLRAYLPPLWTLERRLRKGVALDEERVRYARLCRQIEEVVLGSARPAGGSAEFQAALQAGAFPCVRVGSAYVEFLAQLHAVGTPLGVHDSARLGASIFRPNELRTHLASFEQMARKQRRLGAVAIQDRVWFIRERVLPARCGLVEVPDVLSVSMGEEHVPPAGVMDLRSLWERLLDWLGWRRAAVLALSADQPVRSGFWAVTDEHDWEHFHDGQQGYMKGRLRQQIERAVHGGPPIDLSGQRHNLLTHALREHVGKHRDHVPARAAMSYENGQLARPFPLYCLEPLPDGWAPTRELHVGLVSMRHLPVDRYIDLNWFRNVEVPSQKGFLEADEACFRASVAQFERLLALYRGHRLRLYVYHSGFVPAVVAFYRALTETLASGSHPTGCLQVVPMLQPQGDGHVQGRPWPT